MSGDPALSNVTRKKLCNYIAENPGTTFNVLRSAFKLNDGTLRYHLEFLVKKKKLRAEKIRNRRCYYLFTHRHGRPMIGLNGLSRDQLRLLEIIRENPGIERGEMMEMSNQDRKELTYNLSRLKKFRLIWKISDRKSAGYEYVTDDMLYESLVAALVERLMEGRIDQDEFLVLKERIDLLIDGSSS